MHMWFLWLLLWMSLATALLARFVPARVWHAPARLLRAMAGAWWGPLVLALPVVAADITYPRGFLYASGAWLPPAAEWVHNGAFYVLGLAMYAARDELFALYQKRWPAYAAIGFVTFIAAGAFIERRIALPFAFTYSVTAWFWSFALIGVALKWMSSRNPVLAYLSDSSYWVYLVHFPLTIAFGALLYLADLPALVKMPLNIAATTLVCLASYHLLARFTWVSVLLNGKRHERRATTSPAYASR
jgi:membrane-bound acyltransferase YfiQ involved in biofilm formation